MCGMHMLIHHPNFFMNYFSHQISHCVIHTHTHTHNNLILSHIHYASMLFNYHLKINNFGWKHILKFYNFQGQKHAQIINTKMCCKHEFHQFQLFLKKIINFKMNSAHLIWNKDNSNLKSIVHKQILSVWNMWRTFETLSNFDHWNFLINGV
jgi:hypothetical protein